MRLDSISECEWMKQRAGALDKSPERNSRDIWGLNSDPKLRVPGPV